MKLVSVAGGVINSTQAMVFYTLAMFYTGDGVLHTQAVVFYTHR